MAVKDYIAYALFAMFVIPLCWAYYTGARNAIQEDWKDEL